MTAESLAATYTVEELRQMWLAKIAERDSAKPATPEYRRLYREALHISTAKWLRERQH